MNLTAEKSDKWRDVYASEKSEDYDRFIEMATMGHGRALDALCEMVDRSSAAPLRILELGTGTGLLTQRLLNRFSNASIVGIDGSAQMLEMASRRLSGAAGRFQTRLSSFEEYPWEKVSDGSFDFVVSSFSLHHMEHSIYPGFFKTMLRILKPAGELIVADYTLSAYPRVQERYEEIWAETRMRQTNAAMGLSLTRAEVRMENETRKKAEGDNPAFLTDILCWLEQAGFQEAECYWKHFCYSVYGGKKL